MEIAVKLIEIFLPIILEYVEKHHPDKSQEEHKQIIQEMVSDKLKQFK